MHAGSAIALLLAAALPAAAPASDVIVVASSRSGAFGDALRGIEDELGNSTQLVDISALGRKKAAETLVASSAKVILAVGPLASQVAIAAVPERPLVYCLLPNAKRRGFADNASAQGVPLAVSPYAVFSTIRSALPTARRVSALYDPAESAQDLKRAAADAKRAGIMLIPQPVASGAELSTAVERAFKRSDAVWLLPDRVLSSRESLHYILLKSFEQQVPVVAAFEAQARQGAFLAVMPDPRSHGRAAAAMARAVADGRRPGASDVLETGVTTVLNLRTANRMGLRVPDGFLRTAGEVIK